MRLYHGSNIVITDIDLNKSLKGKDFGKGFYLSDDLKQAEDMAKFKASLLGGDPVINEYEFDENVLTSGCYNVKFFNDYSFDWANFVLALSKSGDV